jgi:deoxyadenosine/deoxycytidine kinase
LSKGKIDAVATTKSPSKPKTKSKAKAKSSKTADVKVKRSAKPSARNSKKVIKHVAIAGNIGSGKTTLARQLGDHFGWDAWFEDVDNNPYLYDFYEDMPRWSFNLQIYFLNNRFNSVIKIWEGKDTVIQDRTIYEDVFIFAPNLHAMGLMSTRDFENYQNLFKTVSKLIKPPDLMIYLRASIPTLVNNIQKRGREYEDSLRLDYIKRLNERYEAWIEDYKEGNIMVIDIDKNNFADKKEDLGEVITRVDAELHGLF